MLRSLGYIPREADIAALTRVVGDVYNGKLNFTAFVKIMVSLIMPSVSTVEDAIEPVGMGLAKHETLFRHRAADSIALSDLKTWMTQHAPEKLTELEWSSWASKLELKDGRISHSMCQALCVRRRRYMGITMHSRTREPPYCFGSQQASSNPLTPKLPLQQRCPLPSRRAQRRISYHLCMHAWH